MKIDGPGPYRTRNGQKALVERMEMDTQNRYAWIGGIELVGGSMENGCSWDAWSGDYWANGVRSVYDIVAKWGEPEVVKPKNHFVIMTTFSLNLALATHKTIAELQKEISTEPFLDCDNALVRCALIVAIMPQPAPGDAKQQATEILHGMPTEGVKAQ